MNIEQELKDWLNHYEKEKTTIEENIKRVEEKRKLLQVKHGIASRAKERLSHKAEKREEFFKKHIEKLEKDYYYIVDNHKEILERNRQDLKYVDAMITEIKATISEYSV